MLSATLTDLAVPSESPQVSVAWQTGLDAGCYLLSTDQVDAFRHGRSLEGEDDVCSKPGAYLVHAVLRLPEQVAVAWTNSAILPELLEP